MALFQWQQTDPTSTVELPAGSLTWGPHGGPDRHKQLAAYWRTDRFGRKHWFVECDEYSSFGPPDTLWRCQRQDGHPLCVIAPLHAGVRDESDPIDLILVCDCGEVGSLDALGWAGDCCGPCSDRRTDGQPAPGRLAVHAHHATVLALAFDEGGRLLSVGSDGSLLRLDPASGDRTRGRRRRARWSWA